LRIQKVSAPFLINACAEPFSWDVDPQQEAARRECDLPVGERDPESGLGELDAQAGDVLVELSERTEVDMETP